MNGTPPASGDPGVTILGRVAIQSIVSDEREDIDPSMVVLTCANCGAEMDERKCKLFCRCGYFLSCSDYY